MEIWKTQPFNFNENIRKETLGLGKGLVEGMNIYFTNRKIAEEKLTQGVELTENEMLDYFLPPYSVRILNELFKITQRKGVSIEKIPDMIFKYFSDFDALLEIPQIKISSVMLSGLVHLAKSGSNKIPKTTNDILFISSYLPYCDAMIVDNDSRKVLTQFPSNAKEKYKLKEFNTKIFAPENRDSFLDYLDNIVAEIPKEQMDIIKDISENYDEPYWNVIVNEKEEDE